MHRLERIGLNIRFEERQIGQPGSLRICATCIEKGATAIKANDRTGRPDAPRKFNRGVTPAASDIQHAVADVKRQRRKHFCAMQMQASGKDVPPGIEFWNQDSVPEINVRVAGFACLRGAHDQVARLL